MKKALLLVAAVAVFGCKQKEVVKETVSVDSTATTQPVAENKFKGLKFDNTKDLFCKMDISHGDVGDTLHYEGKLYGFCSESCKQGFLKDPKKYLAEAK